MVPGENLGNILFHNNKVKKYLLMRWLTPACVHLYVTGFKTLYSGL